jgi:hypothetical protein
MRQRAVVMALAVADPGAAAVAGDQRDEADVGRQRLRVGSAAGASRNSIRASRSRNQGSAERWPAPRRSRIG